MTRYHELHSDRVKDFNNNHLLKECLSDNELLGEVLTNNNKFIFTIIAKYKGNIDRLVEVFNITTDDLLQHAYIAIISSLRRFDFDRGILFTTYVSRPIIWEINNLLYRESQLVKISKKSVELLKRIKELEENSTSMLSIKEMAKELGITEDKVNETLRFTYDMYDSDKVVLASSDCASHVLDKVYTEDLIENASLDSFEEKILSMYMDGYSKSEICVEVGCSNMEVGRTLKRIRSKLKNEYVGKRISKYRQEIDLIADEIEELGKVMPVQDMLELLDVCGFDTDKYSFRILHYIRQKALEKVNKNRIHTKKIRY